VVISNGAGSVLEVAAPCESDGVGVFAGGRDVVPSLDRHDRRSILVEAEGSNEAPLVRRRTIAARVPRDRPSPHGRETWRVELQNLVEAGRVRGPSVLVDVVCR